MSEQEASDGTEASLIATQVADENGRFCWGGWASAGGPFSNLSCEVFLKGWNWFALKCDIINSIEFLFRTWARPCNLEVKVSWSSLPVSFHLFISKQQMKQQMKQTLGVSVLFDWKEEPGDGVPAGFATNSDTFLVVPCCLAQVCPKLAAIHPPTKGGGGTDIQQRSLEQCELCNLLRYLRSMAELEVTSAIAQLQGDIAGQQVKNVVREVERDFEWEMGRLSSLAFGCGHACCSAVLAKDQIEEVDMTSNWLQLCVHHGMSMPRESTYIEVICNKAPGWEKGETSLFGVLFCIPEPCKHGSFLSVQWHSRKIGRTCFMDFSSVQSHRTAASGSPEREGPHLAALPRGVFAHVGLHHRGAWSEVRSVAEHRHPGDEEPLAWRRRRHLSTLLAECARSTGGGAEFGFNLSERTTWKNKENTNTTRWMDGKHRFFAMQTSISFLCF